MRFKEYYQYQVSSSAWTRQSKINQTLAQESIEFLSNFLPRDYNHVLEVGCGDGYAIDLLKKIYPKVIGCDLNPQKLREAKAHQNDVCLQDLHNLGFRKDYFDLIYCAHTLEHSHNGYQALHEFHRILKPGGCVFIIVPDHYKLYGDTFVEADEVVNLEERSSDHYENLLFLKNGYRAETPRNQFPFTMKLLLNVINDSQLELQWTSRIQRNGVELWAIASKPFEDGSVQPITVPKNEKPAWTKKFAGVLKRFMIRKPS